MWTNTKFVLIIFGAAIIWFLCYLTDWTAVADAIQRMRAEEFQKRKHAKAGVPEASAPHKERAPRHRKYKMPAHSTHISPTQRRSLRKERRSDAGGPGEFRRDAGENRGMDVSQDNRVRNALHCRKLVNLRDMMRWALLPDVLYMVHNFVGSTEDRNNWLYLLIKRLSPKDRQLILSEAKHEAGRESESRPPHPLTAGSREDMLVDEVLIALLEESPEPSLRLRWPREVSPESPSSSVSRVLNKSKHITSSALSLPTRTHSKLGVYSLKKRLSRGLSKLREVF